MFNYCSPCNHELPSSTSDAILRSSGAKIKKIVRYVKGRYRILFWPKNWNFSWWMAFHGMGFSYLIVVYHYNSKFKKPIIKLHCDKNLAWFLMLYFILKNGIRNSKRVQLWCPDRQKRFFFIAEISEKRSLVLPILAKHGVFRSLIIVSMLLVKFKELANCDKLLSCEGSRGFTFLDWWQMLVKGVSCVPPQILSWKHWNFDFIRCQLYIRFQFRMKKWIKE